MILFFKFVCSFMLRYGINRTNIKNGGVIMAFLNKIGKAIGDAAGTASEKAKELAETTKLKNAVSAEEKQINQYFLEIGKYVFEEERNNPDSPLAEIFNKITDSLRNIEELKRKIAEIKLDNK